MGKPLIVGACVHMYPPFHNAGAEHMLHAILSQFVKKGVECRVAIRAADGKDYNYELDGVVVGGIELLKECDIILTHLDQTQFTELYCKLNKIPCGQIIHNDARAQMVENCQLLIYNTSHLALKYHEQYNAGIPSIIVHPPIWRDIYKTETSKEYITLINLSQEKGAYILYALANRMKDKQFLGVLGGYGNQMPAPELPNLKIIENQKDAREIYKQTKILLMPSSYESYGRCAIEACVSGIPVIAAPTPGLLEALDFAGVFPPDYRNQSWQQAVIQVEQNYEYYCKQALNRYEQLDPEKEVDALLLKIVATI